MGEFKRMSINYDTDTFINSLNDNNRALYEKNKEIERLSSSIPVGPIDISLPEVDIPMDKEFSLDKRDDGFESQVETYLDLIIHSSTTLDVSEIGDMILAEDYRPRDTLLRIVSELRVNGFDDEKQEILLSRLFSNSNNDMVASDNTVNYRIIVPEETFDDLDEISSNYYVTFGNLFKSIMASGTDNKKVLGVEDVGVFYEASSYNGCRIIFRQIAKDTFLIVKVFIKYCTSNKGYKEKLRLYFTKCLNDEVSYKNKLGDQEFLSLNDDSIVRLMTILSSQQDDTDPKVFKMGGMK